MHESESICSNLCARQDKKPIHYLKHRILLYCDWRIYLYDPYPQHAYNSMNVIVAKNPVDLIGGQPEFPLNVTNGNSKIHYINEYNDANEYQIWQYKFIIIYNSGNISESCNAFNRSD